MKISDKVNVMNDVDDAIMIDVLPLQPFSLQQYVRVSQTSANITQIHDITFRLFIIIRWRGKWEDVVLR